MNLGSIKAELETRLDAISGYTAYSEWPDEPQPPCFIVTADDPYIEPHATFGSNRAMNVYLIVTAILGVTGGVDRAQRGLDLVVAESVIDAIYGTDRTLGGIAQDVIVTSVSGLKQIPIAGATYVGHEFNLSL